MNKLDFKVGRKVFIAFNDSRYRHSNKLYEIIKIGNKWINIENDYRFNPENMQIDRGQYSSPAQVFLSEKEYLDKKYKDKLFTKIRLDIPWSCPIDITIHDLEKVLELLKILMEDK